MDLEKVEQGAATLGFYRGMTALTRTSVTDLLADLEFYADVMGAQDEDKREEYRTNLIDLLADLRRFADHQGIDFQHCLFLAQGHYEAEGGTT